MAPIFSWCYCDIGLTIDENGRGENPNALTLTVDDPIDDPILRKLKDSGFFEQLEAAAVWHHSAAARDI